MEDEKTESIVGKAHKSDLAEILELQKTAFYTEAAFYNNFNIQPMVQTIEEMRLEFKTKTFLKAEIDNRIIGSVRAFMSDSKTCRIEKLVVLQDYRNHGIGSKLLEAIMTRFPKVKRFELSTGKMSAKNIHIYEKFGFQVYAETRVSRIPMVLMEKKA